MLFPLWSGIKKSSAKSKQAKAFSVWLSIHCDQFVAPFTGRNSTVPSLLRSSFAPTKELQEQDSELAYKIASHRKSPLSPGCLLETTLNIWRVGEKIEKYLYVAYVQQSATKWWKNISPLVRLLRQPQRSRVQPLCFWCFYTGFSKMLPQCGHNQCVITKKSTSLKWCNLRTAPSRLKFHFIKVLCWFDSTPKYQKGSNLTTFPRAPGLLDHRNVRPWRRVLCHEPHSKQMFGQTHKMISAKLMFPNAKR